MEKKKQVRRRQAEAQLIYELKEKEAVRVGNCERERERSWEITNRGNGNWNWVDSCIYHSWQSERNKSKSNTARPYTCSGGEREKERERKRKREREREKERDAIEWLFISFFMVVTTVSVSTVVSRWWWWLLLNQKKNSLNNEWKIKIATSSVFTCLCVNYQWWLI